MSDWDEIFGSGDEMDVEDEELRVQTLNSSTLRPSQSAMSIESPQPAPATLFRPPQQRVTPASAPSRQSASRASVKKFADLLKLTKDNQEVLQRMYDITSPGEEYLGTLSYLVFAFQESKGLPGTKWVARRVIRDTFKDQVAEFILRPDLQAYSKSVAEDHTTMVQSLEVLTFVCKTRSKSSYQGSFTVANYIILAKNFLKGLKPEFVDEHCPGDYVAGEACIPGTVMYLFIKETLKNQRSRVRSALLTNILGVAEGSAVKVPACKNIVLQVARTFLPDVRALEDGDALTKLGPSKVKRIIFMRYVTVYYYVNQTENKKRCQWTLMVEILAELCERPAGDASVYFKQVARYDREAFTGKRTWASIKASGALPAPFVDQVLEAAREINALAAQSGNGDEVGASTSGNQVSGEDFEAD
ncbi:uncharacterized protein MELLADRAFT_109637 [Melampsora larici-populina 98AG31]|uniref:Uncharacterized protein n=1 Tax=Melampsora larici-populina (strain 98AG31 / pathotype 3-4-7) TaxID=747676 RepID=F4RX44_MELLP|nr:uncharacterized protein MELLADRAFT_109637 [Melampsora larici-populina 98AG31]EGG03049.1 hypothetical protein MELLADRAFT_109637 [Melampsora larici-populina 98AG31]